MKKMILGACAVLALTVASCGKCGDNSCATGSTIDSLSTAYGENAGTTIFYEFPRFSDNSKDSKMEFLRGMQVVMGADDSRNTVLGMQVATNILAEMQSLEAQGVKLNKAEMMNAFKKAFLSDSISPEQMQHSSYMFMTMMQKAMDEAQAAKAAEKGEEAVDVANVKKGIDYINKLKADSVPVVTEPNGLAYVIEVEGAGEKAQENSTVVVNYTGRHLDGEVFDTTDGRGPAEFNLQQVVPGFREGLMKLAKGGKATLYIPGELGYGKQGNPGGGIEPNEMLIFDVELIDIKPAE